MFPVKCPVPRCECDGKYYDNEDGLDHFDELIEKYNNIVSFEINNPNNRNINVTVIQSYFNVLTLLLAGRRLLEIKIGKDKLND